MGSMSGADHHARRVGLCFTGLVAALCLLGTSCADAQAGHDLPALRMEASHVTILRDDWGIAHVHGHTDRDAVFGMAYAQA